MDPSGSRSPTRNMLSNSVVDGYFEDIYCQSRPKYSQRVHRTPVAAPRSNVAPVQNSEYTIQMQHIAGIADSVKHRHRSKDKKHHHKSHHRSHSHHNSVSADNEENPELNDASPSSHSHHGHHKHRSKSHHRKSHHSKAANEDDSIADDAKIKMANKKKHGRKYWWNDPPPVVVEDEDLGIAGNVIKMLSDAGCTPGKCEHWKRKPYIRIGTCLDPHMRAHSRDIGLLSRIFLNRRRLGCLCRPSYLRFGKLCHLQVRRIKSNKRYKSCFVTDPPEDVVGYVHNMHWNFLQDTEKKVCPFPSCNAVLIGRVNFNDHINLIHNETRKFYCFFCHQGFQTELEKKNHEFEHINAFTQKDGEKSAPNNIQNVNHLNDLDTKPTKLLRTDDYYDKCSDTYTLGKPSESAYEDSEVSMIKCNICGEGCENAVLLQEHYISAHIKKPKCITNAEKPLKIDEPMDTIKTGRVGSTGNKVKYHQNELRNTKIVKSRRNLVENFYKKIEMMLDSVARPYSALLVHAGKNL